MSICTGTACRLSQITSADAVVSGEQRVAVSLSGEEAYIPQAQAGRIAVGRAFRYDTSPGSHFRYFQLPKDVDPADVKANGVNFAEYFRDNLIAGKDGLYRIKIANDVAVTLELSDRRSRKTHTLHLKSRDEANQQGDAAWASEAALSVSGGSASSAEGASTPKGQQAALAHGIEKRRQTEKSYNPVSFTFSVPQDAVQPSFEYAGSAKNGFLRPLDCAGLALAQTAAGTPLKGNYTPLEGAEVAKYDQVGLRVDRQRSADGSWKYTLSTYCHFAGDIVVNFADGRRVTLNTAEALETEDPQSRKPAAQAAPAVSLPPPPQRRTKVPDTAFELPDQENKAQAAFALLEKVVSLSRGLPLTVGKDFPAKAAQLDKRNYLLAVRNTRVPNMIYLYRAQKTEKGFVLHGGYYADSKLPEQPDWNSVRDRLQETSDKETAAKFAYDILSLMHAELAKPAGGK